MAQYNSIVTPTEGATIEFQAQGTTEWITMPGVASISESGNEAPSREVATLQNVVQQSGNVRPPSIEFAIAAYAPLHDSNRVLRDALVNNKTLSFRYTFLGQTLATVAGAGNTMGIATNGDMTFAGTTTVDFTDEAYGPGLALKPAGGNNYYIIYTISSSGDVVVKPAPSSPVAAVVGYTVEIPSIRRPSFPARVTAWDNLDAGSEAQLATTLSIAPTAVLPSMEVAS